MTRAISAGPPLLLVGVREIDFLEMFDHSNLPAHFVVDAKSQAIRGGRLPVNQVGHSGSSISNAS